MALALLLTIAPQSAQSAPGERDRLYGTAGIARDGSVAFADSGERVLSQPDGKVVMVGFRRALSGADTNRKVSVWRFNADASRDATFGPGNSGQTVMVLNGAADEVGAATLQPDGKILVAGSRVLPALNGGKPFWLVTRLTASGDLDVGFGGSGTRDYVIDASATLQRIESMALQADGAILLGGYPNALMRVASNGVPDASFGTNGIVRPPFDGAVTGIAVQADGKILVSGNVSGGNPGASVMRFNTDGTVDSGFAVSGSFLLANMIAKGLSVQPDGGILFGYSDNPNGGTAFFALRLLADGSRDMAFGNSGVASSSSVASVFYAVSARIPVAADGSFALGGSTPAGGFTLARFAANGQPHPMFANFAGTPFGGQGNAMDVTLQADGKALLAGFTPLSTTEAMVIRINTAGGLDAAFNDAASPVAGIAAMGFDCAGNAFPGGLAAAPSGGVYLAYGGGCSNGGMTLVKLDASGQIAPGFSGGVSPGSSSFFFAGNATTSRAVAVQPDGFVVVGGSVNPGATRDFALARVSPAGMPDATFGAAGKLVYSPSAGADELYALAVQSDGKILAAGSAGSNGVVVRFNANGTIDSGFSGGVVTIPGARVNAIALHGAGGILAGVTTTTGGSAVVRLLASGQIDTAFGVNGSVTTPEEFGVTGIAVLSDGAVVAGGVNWIRKWSASGMPRGFSAVAPSAVFAMTATAADRILMLVPGSGGATLRRLLSSGVEDSGFVSGDVLAGLVNPSSLGLAVQGSSVLVAGQKVDGYLPVVSVDNQVLSTPPIAEEFLLEVTKAGSGRVTGLTIDCGPVCAATFNRNTFVTLTATPSANNTFAGWTGACQITVGPCIVEMIGARNVTANFVGQQFQLSVDHSSTGSGTITSVPAGISCTTSCQANFDVDTVVTLTATPLAGSRFAGWSGDCTNATGSCTVTMNRANLVVARFDQIPVLTILPGGTGGGVVTSSPAGIACGSSCSFEFAFDTVVTLTATPDSGSVFAGWSGPCSASLGPCTVTMNVARNISANFTTGTVSFTVTGPPAPHNFSAVSGTLSAPRFFVLTNTGDLTLTGIATEVVPNGFLWSAGTSCGATLAPGASCNINVTLAPPPGTTAVGVNSTFRVLTANAGSSADIPVAGTVLLPTVTAIPATLDFSALAGGVSAPQTVSFVSNGALANTAPAVANSVFQIVTDGCSRTFLAAGTPCTVSVRYVPDMPSGSNGGQLSLVADTNFAASLARSTLGVAPLQGVVTPAFTLAVTKSGNGSGSVTSTPAGIDCGVACSASFAQGATVTLLPDPSGGSNFGGWSGACTGTGACSVTMDAAKTVTATFTLPAPTPTPAFAYIPNQNSGNVSVIDTLTNAIVNTIFTGNNPNGIAVNAAGTRAYVGNGGSNTVSAIDTFTGNVLANIPVGSPFGVAINPAGTRVYVANVISGALVVIDAATNTVVASIANAALRGLAVNPAGTRVYSSNFDNVKVIDATSNTVVATVPITAAPPNTPTPQGMAMHPAGTQVYVANQSNNTVEVIDTASNTVAATIAVGSSPVGVGFNPAGTRAYVTNSIGNSVSVIDTATRAVVATVPVGTRPQGVSVTPDGLRAYVANRNSHNVSVIDTATNTVIATVAAGTNPTAYGHFTGPAPAVPPNTLTVIRTGTGSGTVTSSPAGIDCGMTCSASFAASSTVTLTATPAAGGTFVGWSGDCLGTGDCLVTMGAERNVTATFEAPQFTVTVGPSAGGRVTSTPAGIDCPGTCSAGFAAGSSVTLTPLPDANFAVDGWAGCPAAAGTGPCTFTVTNNVFMNLGFRRVAVNITVVKAGLGTGTVTSAQAGGIACGAVCTVTWPFATAFQLLPGVADAGSLFSGFSGGNCSGTGACNIDTGADRTITARFDLNSPAFTVTNTAASGAGSFAEVLSTIYDAATDTCLPGTKTITFNIPAATDPGCNAATGICSIPMPNTPSEQNIRCGDLIIDGTTQPGASPNTATDRTNNAQIKIELGANLTGNFAGAIAIGRATTHGFGNFSANNVTIRGIAFPRHSLLLRTGNSGSIPHGGSGHVVAGNVFGWHADGTPAVAPVSEGIHLYGGFLSASAIGGPNPADRNMLTNPSSANALGIRADGAANVLFEGNYINIDRNGAPVAAPGMTGIRVWQDNGNNTPPSINNVIRRNVIVTGTTGPVFTGTGGGNTVSENILFGHPAHLPGINFFSLAGGGTNPQLAPVVSAVNVLSGEVLVSGTVTADAMGMVRLEFFDNPEAFQGGRAASFLGGMVVTTDAAGQASFTKSLPASARHVAVTATRLSTGDTSMFANYVAPTVPPNATLNVFKSGGGSGTVTGAGINCGSSCTAQVATGSTITLTAAPAPGILFLGWLTGFPALCPRGALTCTFTINSATSVTAVFSATDTEPPTAVLSGPIVADLGATIVLDGSQSTDIGGSIVSYEFSLEEKPAGSTLLPVPIVQSTPTLAVTLQQPGRHNFQLRVTDSSGNVSFYSSLPTIVVDNFPPTAVLDAPATGSVGNPVNLSGAQSSDGFGGQVMTYLWNATQRPAGATAFAAGVVTSTPQFSFTPDVAGTWVVSLKVFDDGFIPSPQVFATINVSATDTIAPVPGMSLSPATPRVGTLQRISFAPSTDAGGSGIDTYAISLLACAGGCAPYEIGSGNGQYSILSANDVGFTFTPLVTGSIRFAVIVTDRAGNVGSSEFTLNVLSATATVPAAPVITSATAGEKSATLAFTTPADGGSAITGYTATCGSRSASGAFSPLTVTGLTNAVTVSCTVRAANVLGSSAPSAAVQVTPQSTLVLQSVVSRKVHGINAQFTGNGTPHDLAVNINAPITGNISVEPRADVFSQHTLIFDFNAAVTSFGAITVKDAAGNNVGAASGSIVGSLLQVRLSGIPDRKRVTVTVNDVNDSRDVSVSMGFLVGDANGSGRVTAADILVTKLKQGQSTSNANFRFDFNRSGTIDSVDLSVVKARSGAILP